MFTRFEGDALERCYRFAIKPAFKATLSFGERELTKGMGTPNLLLRRGRRFGNL